MKHHTSHNSIQYKTDKEFESREYKIVKNKVIWSLLRNYFRKTPFLCLFIYLLRMLFKHMLSHGNEKFVHPIWSIFKFHSDGTFGTAFLHHHNHL